MTLAILATLCAVVIAFVAAVALGSVLPPAFFGLGFIVGGVWHGRDE